MVSAFSAFAQGSGGDEEMEEQTHDEYRRQIVYMAEDKQAACGQAYEDDDSHWQDIFFG